MGSRSVGSPVNEDVVATLVDRVIEVLEARLKVRDIVGVSVPVSTQGTDISQPAHGRHSQEPPPSSTPSGTSPDFWERISASYSSNTHSLGDTRNFLRIP